MGRFFIWVFTLGWKRSLKHVDAVVALRGYLDRKIKEWEGILAESERRNLTNGEALKKVPDSYSKAIEKNRLKRWF